jgi:hypothetical protein
MTALRPDQILKILAVTDSFNLHREAILIPLTTTEKGTVNLLSDGRLKITCPTGPSFEMWLDELRDRLQKMDLSKFRTLQS